MTHRCIQPFVAPGKEGKRHVRIGDVFADGDPILKGRDVFFETIEQAAAKTATPTRRIARPGPVESATARPGEKRRRGRPRKAETPGTFAPNSPADGSPVEVDGEATAEVDSPARPADPDSLDSAE